MGSPPDSAVFDFENILPQLDFLPIAARRALDHSGLRLSLEAWRSLGLEDRCQLVTAGAQDIVDGAVVAAVVRRATPSAQRIEVVGDPDPLAPPDGLLRLLEPVPLDAKQWARLRALDRYALAHVHRRSIARNDPSLIQSAYEDIVTGHLRSLRPPPRDGGDGAFPNVPPPPGIPRSEPSRGLRGLEITPPSGRPISSPLPRSSERSLGSSPSPRAYESSSPATTFDSPPPGFSYNAPTPPRMKRPDTPLSGRGYDQPRFGRGPDLGRQLDSRSEDRSTLESPQPSPLAPPSSSQQRGYSAPRAAASFGRRESREEIPELTIPTSNALSSHLTPDGEARMVDVGQKPVTQREAVASAVVRMRSETLRRLEQQDTPKGDVLAAARIAGISAAKRTSELIPLCHLIALTSVEITLALDAASSSVRITATARASDRTGVEMEALVAASVAGLTIYDMLKGIDRDMSLDDVKLLEKSGGRTGHYRRREG